MKFVLLINAKMPTIIVDLLAFICWINTKLRSKIFIFQQFSLYELLKFHAQFSIKKMGPGSFQLSRWNYIGIHLEK